MHTRLPSGPHRARRLALAALLPALLAGPLWLAAPQQARAQTSTPIYGSDTDYVQNYSPPLRLGANANYASGGQLNLGAQGQPVTNFGSAYDPDSVDVSQGFVARMDTFTNGGNGVAFVVKNPGVATDVETPAAPAYGTIQGLGAYGLPSSLGVAFITFHQTPDNHNDRHYKEVEVFTDDANGTPTVLADVQHLDLDENTDGNQVLQVRFLPKFQTLDVYVGSRLITRVFGVDLAKLGIAAGGEAELGVTGGLPSDYGTNTAYFPASLNHFSVGNQLAFGAGFGPNYYEDRFPFLTKGQSVWGQNSDSAEYKKFLGATSHGQTLTSDQIGFDASPVFSLYTSAFASYDVGIGIDATATGGTADITYPLLLDMLFPKQYSVNPGDTFTLPITYTPDLAAGITTTSPSANVKTDLQLQTDFGVNLDTSVFGHSLASGKLFDIPINIPDTTFFDAQKVIKSGLIPFVSGGVNYAGYFQNDEGKTGKKTGQPHGEPGKGSAGGAGKGVSPMDFVTVNVTVPDLSTSGFVGGGSGAGSHLTSSAAQPFVTLQSDFTNSLLGLIPGLDLLPDLPFFNNDYTLNLGGQTEALGFHIADLYGSLYLGTSVNYDFTPAPQVYLTLTAPTDGYPQYLGPFGLDPATNQVLNPPALTMPPAGVPLTVTPSVVLNSSTLQTTGALTIGGTLAFDPFDLYFQFGALSLDTRGKFGWPFALAGHIPIVPFTTTFPVGLESGGVANAVPFQPILTGKPFTLLPKASPFPLIDAVSPASALAGSGDVPLDATTESASFNGQIVWDYDGVASDPQTGLANRQFNGPGDVTATVPAALLTAQGLHTITLINQDSDANLFPSNSVAFVVNAPAPHLSGVSALTTNGVIVEGGPKFTLSVGGSGFSPPVMGASGVEYRGSVVQWNGQALATDYGSGTALKAVVPQNLIASAGTAQITVVTGAPGGGLSEALPLTVVNPLPVLTSLSQSTSAPGLSSLTLILNGSGFVPGSTVLWSDGTTATTKTPAYDSTTSLTLTLSASDLATPHAYALQVVNPLPGGGVSAARTFTVGAYPAGGTIIVIPSVSRSAAGLAVTLTVVNTSRTAPTVSTGVFAVSVGGDSRGKGAVYPATPSPLQPLLLGSIPANASVSPSQVFTFPATLGARGKPVLLTVAGSSSGRTFSSRLRVILP